MEPMLVVVRLKILGWMHQLDGRPELIDVEMPARKRQDEHSEHSPLPVSPKDRLAGGDVGGTHAVTAAEIMDAVHFFAPGVFARPTPIMLSRVTKFASAASSRPSLPSGRCGNTR